MERNKKEDAIKDKTLLKPLFRFIKKTYFILNLLNKKFTYVDKKKRPYILKFV